MRTNSEALAEIHAEKAATKTAEAVVYEDAQKAQHAREDELRSFGQSPAFEIVKEVLNPLLIHAIEGCFHGRDEERIKAQGAFEFLTAFLKPFGHGVAHGMGTFQEA